MQERPDRPGIRRKSPLSALADEPRFLMLLPGLFWAGNAIVARSTVGVVPPIGLAFWRWILAAAIVLPFAWPHLVRDAGTLRRNWRIVTLLSALGISIFNTFLYLGAQTTMAINLVMLQSAIPVLVVGATFLLFRETVTARQAAGIAISLAGAITLIAHGDLGVLAHLDFHEGDLWMLAAVVTYAFYTALLRRRPDVHTLSFLFSIFFIGALLLLPPYLAETAMGHPVSLNVSLLLAVGYVAVFASILSYFAFNRTIELLGPNRGALAVHLVPVFGTILAMLFLGEAPHPYHAVGIGLIAVGIWLATRKPAPEV
jgi:drug/metabolite transporter (DMT)-like permease